MKTHFHEVYVLPQWDLTLQQTLLVQKQVYTPSHAAQPNYYWEMKLVAKL